jgi:GNAT superfamily N-acetyltransferase
LRDFSASALVEAIKANPVAWWRYLGRSPGAEFHDSPELTWLLSGIPNSFVNPVFRTQIRPDNADAVIARTLARFRARGVTTFSWWLGPDTQPADLGTRLIDHGLTYAEGAPGMAADLFELPEELPPIAGLSIEPVVDEKALRAWAYASLIGFGVPERYVDSWFDLFLRLGFELPLRSYLGTLDGRPVAASQLFLGAGVAGIYVVATTPDARRQGIGAAVTLAALRDARTLGFRIGILHSSPMGLGVYRRLGFREYCRMSCYGRWVSDAS